MAASRRENAEDDDATWEYRQGSMKATTWGPWTDVLTYPAGRGKHEKGPLGATFGNFTSKDPYKSAMHGPPRGKNAGVYEWRVVLEGDAAEFGGSFFVFYLGKASAALGVHQRVRNESLGMQGGNMNAFFYAVLDEIKRSRTNLEFSVKFQARSSAITNDANVVSVDRNRHVNQQLGYFPSVQSEVDSGGCSEGKAEENLLARFDYAACKMNNNDTRLGDFQNWLKKKFSILPRVVSVVRPALEGHVLSGDPEWNEYDVFLSADAVNTIVEALENLGVGDSDEVAEVLQIAAAEGYKKACANFQLQREAAAYPDGGHSSAGFEFP